MIEKPPAHDFFKKRQRAPRSNLVDLTSEAASTSSAAPPPKKKYAKHRSTNGFTQQNIDEEMSKLKQTKHAWRRVQPVIDVAYTTVIQKFEFEGKSIERSHFCPWGTHGMMMNKMSAIQVKNSYQSLPNEVKEALGITSENFVRDDIIVSCSNTGYHAKKPFVRVFCDHCQTKTIPKMLNNPKFGNCSSFEDLLLSWDEQKISKLLCGVIGSFISTMDPKIYAGPNTSTYLKDPTEHMKTYHPDLLEKEMTDKQLKFVKDIQLLIGKNSDADRPLPPMKVAKPSQSNSDTASQENLPNQSYVVGKFHKKTQYHSIQSMMDLKLKTSDVSRTQIQQVAKGFCFSIVHAGVNERLSEASVIKQYNISFRGIMDHYEVQQNDVKDRYGESDNNIKLLKPQECCLDKNNIVKYEKSLLKAYTDDPDSLYSIVKKAKYWSIVHDGIQKFSVEYNGIFITTINPDTFKLLLLPFRLMKMKAGVDAHATCESLFTAFSEFINLKDSAYTTIHKMEGLADCANPPTFFKLGVVLSCSETEIHLTMSDSLPIANIGDGVGVNTKAARVMAVLFGLLTPDYRCFAHSIDGCWKRIARSETMCVEAVKKLYEALKLVVKHFKNSGKSLELLNKSIEVLEMTKGVHLMNWCATRMAHFLVACERFNVLLVSVYYTMYTANIKPEERDSLFHVDNMYTMKVVADVHGLMHNKLLRSGDETECLVSTAYSSANSTATKVASMDCPTAEKFLDSLSLDENGNLHFKEVHHETTHTLRLADSHRPQRGRSEDVRLQKIKDSLVKIKSDILNNIHDNLKDQIGEDTYFYNWSGMDLNDKSQDLEERLLRLDPLFVVFTSARVHEVQQFRTANEGGDDTIPFKWNGRKIFLHYESSIDCSHEDLVEEMTTAWPYISRAWLKHEDKKDQRGFLETFLSGPDAGIRFPNFCNFLMILLSTPANTSPLERSFTGLEMICTPRRNHISPDHLECLYMLSTLQIPVKSSMHYNKEIEILASMK